MEASSRRSAVFVYLGHAARQHREQAGLDYEDITGLIPRDVRGRKEASLRRFENAENLPINLDAIIAAYAQAGDVTPPDIWRTALELWSDALAS